MGVTFQEAEQAENPPNKNEEWLIAGKKTRVVNLSDDPIKSNHPILGEDNLPPGQMREYQPGTTFPNAKDKDGESVDLRTTEEGGNSVIFNTNPFDNDSNKGVFGNGLKED